MVIGLYDIFNARWGAQTIWLYSDPHFGETEEESGLAHKPTDAEQVRRINSKVGRKDTIIFLGDIGDPSWLKSIRGYKVLITGNHDSGVSNYQRYIARRIFDSDKYTKADVYAEMKHDYPDCSIDIEKSYGFHMPFTKWVATMDNQLCDEVYNGPLIIGPKLVLSHEPIIGLNWAMNLHGHTHNALQEISDYHFNCCSDKINYIPINLNRLLKNGLVSQIDSIHRQTIDKATFRKNNINCT